MGSRLDLHNKLLQFIPNVYFQPPSDVQMVYPCVAYSKIEKINVFADDVRYLSKQGYQLMLIERVPDSGIADNIEGGFEYCTISQYYTVNNLNHTILTLYY